MWLDVVVGCSGVEEGLALLCLAGLGCPGRFAGGAGVRNAEVCLNEYQVFLLVVFTAANKGFVSVSHSEA